MTNKVVIHRGRRGDPGTNGINGAAPSAIRKSIIRNTVLDILISGKYMNQLKNGRKNIIERLNYLNDGNSASRIYNYLTFPNKNDDL